MAEPEWQAEAREHFEHGYQAQMAGRLEDALECYRRSLAIQETAEAHTFLGWAMAHQGKHEEAIEECKRAIAVDPTFGQPVADPTHITLGRGTQVDTVSLLGALKVAAARPLPAP